MQKIAGWAGQWKPWYLYKPNHEMIFILEKPIKMNF